MNRLIGPIAAGIALIVAIATTVFFLRRDDAPNAPTATAHADMEGAGDRILFYRHPMDPSITSPVPQKDSMGMDFIPVHADDAAQGAEVSVSPEIVQTLGVRTERAARGTLSRHIDTVGYVAYNESLIGHMHLRAEGWVEALKVNTVGDRVETGQLLFTFYSPTLLNAQEEFVQALARGNQRLIDASRQKLQSLGISPSRIESLGKSRKVERTIDVYSHQPGVISALNVREGMYVEPATEAMTVVDLRNVWLLAEVFERQATWVEIGQQAEAEVAAFPGRKWTGTVDYVYPSLDPVTRTLKVRLRFDNPGEILRPNMFAHVNIFSSPRAGVLTVSSESVIRQGGDVRVILALGTGRFAPRQVRTGIESGGQVEILDGLAEGDEVVVSAQFLLDSEASLRAGFHRMEPAPPHRHSPFHVEVEGGGTAQGNGEEQPR